MHVTISTSFIDLTNYSTTFNGVVSWSAIFIFIAFLEVELRTRIHVDSSILCTAVSERLLNSKSLGQSAYSPTVHILNSRHFGSSLARASQKEGPNIIVLLMLLSITTTFNYVVMFLLILVRLQLVTLAMLDVMRQGQTVYLNCPACR